jgi:hypothetical protein
MSQARIPAPIRRLTGRSGGAEPEVFDLADLKPLPAWFFAFEGVLAGAFDIIKIDPNLVAVLIGLGAVNAIVSATVLRRRIKMARAMLRNRRTRFIALGLVALRMAVHAALTAVGAAVTGPAAHAVLATAMAAMTVALLNFDQKVTLRALTAALGTPVPTVVPAVAQA